MHQELSVTIQGIEQYDLEIALEEVKRLVSEGFTSGMNRNDSGNFNFNINNNEGEI